MYLFYTSNIGALIIRIGFRNRQNSIGALAQKNVNLSNYSRIIWVVVKNMVPFWAPIIIRHLLG